LAQSHRPRVSRFLAAPPIVDAASLHETSGDWGWLRHLGWLCCSAAGVRSTNLGVEDMQRASRHISDQAFVDEMRVVIQGDDDDNDREPVFVSAPHTLRSRKLS
jgi:hypothetical protein